MTKYQINFVPIGLRIQRKTVPS